MIYSRYQINLDEIVDDKDKDNDEAEDSPQQSWLQKVQHLLLDPDNNQSEDDDVDDQDENVADGDPWMTIFIRACCHRNDQQDKDYKNNRCDPDSKF